MSGHGERVRGLRRVAVFCGARPGARAAYAEAAASLGRCLAARGVGLVFGGGRVGLMGVVADAVLAAGGEATGVIPHGLLAREIGHEGLTRLHVVGSMHERKALMADLADAFVALPGGIGTLEELMEAWTWGYLGIHRKPVGLLNVEGYYDALLAWVDRAVADGFLREVHRELLLTSTEPDDLLARLAAYAPPELPRWASPAER